MDGAGKVQRIWHIDIPGILPTVIILPIMHVGKIMNVGFQKVLLMQNPKKKWRGTYEKSSIRWSCTGPYRMWFEAESGRGINLELRQKEIQQFPKPEPSLS